MYTAPVEQDKMDESIFIADSPVRMSAEALTELVYENTIDRGEIYLTCTIVGHTYAIWVLCGHPKIEKRYVRKAYHILVQTTEEVLHSY